MIKIWCEKCKGTREQLNQNPFNVIRRLCPECDGKGYTEHDGTLEDLELAQAIKLLFKTGQHHIIQTYKGCRQAYFYDKKMLIDWYMKQKGGTE